VVGAAATAEDIETRQDFPELDVVLAQLGGIARVQIGAFIQLGVAAAGGVRAQSADALEPRCARWQFFGKVCGMRAVDHLIGRWLCGSSVHPLNGLAQGLAARQPTVGLQREGNDHWNI